VGFGVGDGPGVGVDGAAPVASGEVTGLGPEASGLAIADGTALPAAIVGGDAVPATGEVPPPTASPKRMAPTTPTTRAISP
jgi:hypothetical protein